MKNRWFTVLLSCAVLVLGACSSPQSGGDKAQPAASIDTVAARLTSLADEYVRESLARFPEQATAMGLANVSHDKLSDNSLDALKAWQAKEDAWASELAGIDGRSLWGRPEWLTYGFLKEALESSRQLRVARTELWTVNQLSGWQASATQLAAIQPVGTRELRNQALARWRQLPRYLDTEVSNLKEGIRLGYTTPKRNVKLVIAQLDAILAAPVTKSPFYSPAQRAGTPEFKTAWETLLVQEANPAIRRYRDFLENEYLAKARETTGISAFPNGPECYRAFLRSYTNLDRSAEETFRLGEQYVAKYEAEASEIGRKIFGTADLKVIRDKMQNDPRNHFKSREELLNFSKEAVARARQALPGWFNIIPKAEVVIEPIPDFLEQTASNHYEAAAEDGSRPGVYMINLYQPENQTRAGAEVTAFHETYPGHHFQISVAQELPKAHMISHLAGSASYVEGWARYTEALAEEMGLYTTDFARINRRVWPAHGMVVDPGIHVMGWTRQKAVDYVMSTGRFTSHEAESLVDRIIGWPAQLTCYDTGAIEYFDLRRQAEQALGSKFDIRSFHDQLLIHGSVTLPMLREIVEHWILERQKAQ